MDDGNRVDFEKLTLAMYNIGSAWRASDGPRPQELASLSEASEGDVIECPLHQGYFRIAAGQADGRR